MLIATIAASALWITTGHALPHVYVTSDNARITKSCVVVIPADTIIEDTNADGVIQILCSDLEITFAAGSHLRGSPNDRPPDEYRGYGIRLDGQSNVTIRGAHVSGFRGGLHATSADGLILDAVDASDNRRARLKSSPMAEDGSDWLFPHNNDQNEWLSNYGAAVYVEDSDHITVRNCRVRHGQNALCLDRVSDARVYDNDFSFNSGWGIALWRSNRNVITRNACDFCVRGYSHGVYNRGQDSAGILMFEQNSQNVVAENSATHSGDGFFGFAGREALGETGIHPTDWHSRRGNNANLLVNNDFSYAAAHGIEMTFSFGNVFYGNRLVENAICGVWGGYSQDTLIARNRVEGNGEMAYGLERGGINIEHGRNNRILGNRFKANKCGVHLWWDPDGDFSQKPWAKANRTESKGNVIADNRFVGDTVALHFRGPSELVSSGNSFEDVDRKMTTDPQVIVREEPNVSGTAVEEPQYLAYGTSEPVGARLPLRGRHNIIMTEWGPWDHESPLIRLAEDDGDSVRYDLFNVPATARVTLEGRGTTGKLFRTQEKKLQAEYTVSTANRGVHPYLLRVKTGDWQQEIRNTLVSTSWDVAFFRWTEDTDPREDLDSWRRLCQGDTAVSGQTKRLVFQYGWGGPSEQHLSDTITATRMPGDHFGMIARTRLPLSAGTWEFVTLSDDGVRVIVDGQEIIENWTWHGPTRNTGTLELHEDRPVQITVEHFEIDGYAVLELEILRNDPVDSSSR